MANDRKKQIQLNVTVHTGFELSSVDVLVDSAVSMPDDVRRAVTAQHPHHYGHKIIAIRYYTKQNT